MHPMSNLMLWNPSNRCQWPVPKVSFKKLTPSYLTSASKYAQNFGSVTGMWLCVHLVKIVYHSHPAVTCQKAILRFTMHWHAYYGINTNKILKKIAWVRPVMDNFWVCSFSMAKVSVSNPIISCATQSKKPTNYHTRANIFIPTCPQMT